MRKAGWLFFSAIIFALLFTSLQATAQTIYEDVVYLKNGNVIHGIIIEQIPKESLKIKTADNSIFVFKLDEILKITKEELATKNSKPVKVKNLEKKKMGFTDILEGSFSWSFVKTNSDYEYNGHTYPNNSEFDQMNNTLSLGAHNVFGYLFNPWFSTGAGIGTQIYSSELFVPLFLDLRANFLDNNISPFANAKVGYSFSINEILGNDNNIEGGLMGSFSGGLKYFVNPRMAITFSVGLLYQEVKTYDNYSNYNYNPEISTRSMNRLLIQTGFVF